MWYFIRFLNFILVKLQESIMWCIWYVLYSGFDGGSWTNMELFKKNEPIKIKIYLTKGEKPHTTRKFCWWTKKNEGFAIFVLYHPKLLRGTAKDIIYMYTIG